eukprot:CAMPEP_0176231470 /NCGR_PEP_ID=MMETSP0121_2-20121125/24817_1 /TAXON_ID=160619 /ORGANISM="Kryptoperidinium foliaceum, Strain CCMP 1326" /LENGTH=372 /DNA_ID=CAMNT_0017570817 /DNA_START=1 /DNA_END=1115 /DNA_ORIENTATION=+
MGGWGNDGEDAPVKRASMDEFADLKSSVARLQSQLKRDLDRVDEAVEKRLKLSDDLDERLQKLEQAHRHFTGKVEQSLESLWQRATELGVALAEMPPAESLHTVMQKVESLQAQVSFCDTSTVEIREETLARTTAVDAFLTQSRRDTEASVSSLDAVVRQLRRDVEAMVESQRSAQNDALQRARRDFEGSLQQGLAEAVGEAREGIRDLSSQVFGESRESLRQALARAQEEMRESLRELSWRVFGTPCEPIASCRPLLVAPPAGPPPATAGGRRPLCARGVGASASAFEQGGAALSAASEWSLSARLTVAEGRCGDLERLCAEAATLGQQHAERLADVASRFNGTDKELKVIRDVLETKADRWHTHDQLVSA